MNNVIPTLHHDQLYSNLLRGQQIKSITNHSINLSLSLTHTRMKSITNYMKSIICMYVSCVLRTYALNYILANYLLEQQSVLYVYNVRHNLLSKSTRKCAILVVQTHRSPRGSLRHSSPEICIDTLRRASLWTLPGYCVLLS